MAPNLTIDYQLKYYRLTLLIGNIINEVIFNCQTKHDREMERVQKRI